MQRQIGNTTYHVIFLMTDSADHVTGKIGLTPTVTISKNGGAYGAASGAVTEIANGVYKLAANATDFNTLGAMAIHAAATGADPADLLLEVVSYDPFAAVAEILTDTGTTIPAQITNVPSLTADSVWDEVLTGATHNVAASAGRRLRQLADIVIIDGIAVSATSNSITFNGDASSVDGAYDPALIYIASGTGAGQCRGILEYFGSTKTAIVDRDWKVIPNSTSEYVIVGDAGREHVNEGLIRTAGSDWAQLNTNASSYDGSYVGQRIFIRSGHGADQVRRVESYSGSTKIATVTRVWDEVPDATSAYVMLPTGSISDNDIADAVDISDTAALVEDLDATSFSVSDIVEAVYNRFASSTIAALQNRTLISQVRGSTWDFDIDVSIPVSATDLTFTIKKVASDTAANAILTIHNSVVSIINKTAAPAEAVGSVELDGTGTVLTVKLDDASTLLIPATETGLWHYGIQYTDGGENFEVYQGNFVVIRNIVG